VTDDVISALVSTSAGDLRRSITYLQSASRLASSTDPPALITPRDIQEIAGVVPDQVMNCFASSLGVDSTPSTSSKAEKQNFDLIRQQVKSLMREGYSAAQILSQLHDLIIQHPVLAARQKSACALAFADADHALCDGADEELWVLQVALRVNKAIS